MEGGRPPAEDIDSPCASTAASDPSSGVSRVDDVLCVLSAECTCLVLSCLEPTEATAFRAVCWETAEYLAIAIFWLAASTLCNFFQLLRRAS